MFIRQRIERFVFRITNTSERFAGSDRRTRAFALGVTGVLLLPLGLVFGFANFFTQEESSAPVQHAHPPSVSTAPHTHAQGHDTHEGKGHTHAQEGHHGEGEKEAEETPPETFVVLDLFSEALEASVAGVGVKLVELKPKVEHVSDMYQNGEKHKAFSKALGISTELVMLGVFIETFGISDLFVSALSFPSDWMMLMARSSIGVMLSTKVALLAGEKVEEATMEHYKEDVDAESKTSTLERTHDHTQ